MVRRLLDRVSEWLAQRNDHHYLGRYSITKLQHFDAYQRNASCLRVFAVILFTPLPTFFVLMAMDAVPMNSPSAGPSKNAVAFVRSTASHATMTFFTLLPLKQALSLSNRGYSFKTITCIACSTALTVEVVCIPLAFAWRFPVPFREMIGLPVWITSVCVYNYVFAKRTIRRLWRRHKLQVYVPIVGVQVSLFYVFLGLSAGFAYLALIPQTAMILLFPLMKMVIKNYVWKYARALDDISTDVSICMLEVSGSLFQTVCLQFVTSHVLSVLIMVSDFVQAFHEVRSYMRMDYLSDGRRTLPTAMAIVESITNGDHAGEDARASTFQGSTIVPSEWDDISLAPDVPPVNDEDRVPVIVMRRPIIRQASVESMRSRPMTRQSSVESMRSMGISRQSSMESLRSTKHHRSSEDDALPERAGKLELRSKSVYVHPTNVRRADTSQRRRSSRRLLDLDRLAANPDLLHEPGEREAHTQAERVTDKVHPVATKRKPRARHRRSHVSRWLQRVFRRTQGKHGRRRSSKVYAIQDPTTSVPSPRTSKTEILAPRRPSGTNCALQLTDVASPQTTQMPTARTTARRSSRGFRIDSVVITRRHQARVLEQTLQLLFVCEVLLFAEYMEVVIPVLYSLTLAGEWVTPNAAYNVVVSGMSGGQAAQQVWTWLLYALLELASLLVMYFVMKRKYGVSAFYQLAFVLEKYWLTLQGKLVGAFIVVMNAVTVHQGADVFTRL